MPFQVKDHFIYQDGVRVPLRSTPNRGGLLKPEVLVLHDTAGRLDIKGSVDWMCNPAARASAHLCVGRDGEVVQMVPLNKQAWHAGKSAYNGRKFVNGFGIGIEIVNPGSMTTSSDLKCAVAWYKQQFSIPFYGIKWVKDHDHPGAQWMPYPEAQIKVVTELTKVITAAYSLKDVTTHFAISPGRKVDVNPLFPLEMVRKVALGPACRIMGRA